MNDTRGQIPPSPPSKLMAVHHLVSPRTVRKKEIDFLKNFWYNYYRKEREGQKKNGY